MPRPRATHIPKPYRFAHNFAFYLHDTLVHHLVSGEQAGIFNLHFELPSNTDFDIEGFNRLHGEELWQWLEDNDHIWVLDEMVYRQTLAAVLSDLCHFVFEALCCSQKAKLTVTYALLRKPFRENLLILEWLLGDPEGFCTTFRGSSPHSVDVSGLKPGPIANGLLWLHAGVMWLVYSPVVLLLQALPQTRSTSRVLPA